MYIKISPSWYNKFLFIKYFLDFQGFFDDPWLDETDHEQVPGHILNGNASSAGSSRDIRNGRNGSSVVHSFQENQSSSLIKSEPLLEEQQVTPIKSTIQVKIDCLAKRLNCFSLITPILVKLAY